MANSDYVLAEYVWVDADGGYRSKTKVIHGKKKVTLSDLPNWNYDGSSTGQAPGEDSEVIIKPKAVYHDPFRGGNHVLVMTDMWTPTKPDGSGNEPIPSNTRAEAEALFNQKLEEEPWFGIEQEYTLFKNGVPLGWPTSKAFSGIGPTVQLGYPGPQGPYYCSAGADVAFGREMVEDHLDKMLKAGIQCSGINAEVMPGQWEYQVGPCVGIEAGDQLSISRYMLNRVAEKHGYIVSLDPKPIPGDWNGAGCHTNFSTKAMREVDNSLETVMKPMFQRLEAAHKEHFSRYGAGNERRLTGKHETASYEEFKWGVADRGASIRVGNDTAIKGKGYFEDRRPASNMDPYVVTSLLFRTCCLDA